MLTTDGRSSPSDLSPARRAKRGFTRLGFALAMVVLLVGTVFSIGSSYQTAESNTGRHQGMLCLRAALAAGKLYSEQNFPDFVDVDRSGCPGTYFTSVATLRNYNEPAPNFTMVLAGFLRD